MKLYSSFVVFRAAFNNVCRNSLFYKLYQMGMSYKIVNFVKNIYSYTEYAVWTGEDLSDYISSKSDVKQGCLLLHKWYTWLSTRWDFVVCCLYRYSCRWYSNPMSLIITNLEEYCFLWNLEINIDKSDIFIFKRDVLIKHTNAFK